MADTNVLVCGLITRRGICGQLLDAGFDGRWRLVVSALRDNDCGALVAGGSLD